MKKRCREKWGVSRSGREIRENGEESNPNTGLSIDSSINTYKKYHCKQPLVSDFMFEILCSV